MTDICISRDIGGTRGLRRVVKEMRQRGEDVFFLPQAGAMAEKVLTEAGEPFQGVASVEEVIELIGALRPRAVLMSWCTEVGRAALPFLSKQGVPTVLVEDTWWHGGVLDALPDDGRPGLVCVGTEHDRARVLEAWPGYSPEQIEVTGWPGFDEYASYNVAQTTEDVRAALGLESDWPLVLLSIDNEPGVAEMVAVFIEALNTLGRPVYLVPSWHPAFDKDVPEEGFGVKAALERFEAGRIVAQGKIPTAKIVVAADVFVATFSSLLTVKAALRGSAVAFLDPYTGQQQMEAEMGTKEFPPVALGCVAKAATPQELFELLRRALGPGLGLEKAQERHFRLDGRNARRVAESVNRFL